MKLFELFDPVGTDSVAILKALRGKMQKVLWGLPEKVVPEVHKQAHDLEADIEKNGPDLEEKDGKQVPTPGGNIDQYLKLLQKYKNYRIGQIKSLLNRKKK